MSILNIMEEKIKSTFDEVINNRQDRFVLVDYREDIIAYVLNRVPSRYITSERGFVHNEIDFAINTQLIADIRLCVNDAIRTLQTRREPTIDPWMYEKTINKHKYFPYIMGEVLEESTFSIIPNVNAQLLFNNFPVPMIDTGWKNPYSTCSATNGYFLFWPDFVEGDMNTDEDNIFKIIFRHKKFNKKEVHFKLRTLEKINFNKAKVIPVTLMRLKKGVDVSFLYSKGKKVRTYKQ